MSRGTAPQAAVSLTNVVDLAGRRHYVLIVGLRALRAAVRGRRGATTMTLGEGLRRSFPTVFLMARPFEWIGKSRGRICGAALVALAVVVGPPIWWATQFWGLPDIGDPFDVAAFRALTIPVDRNAYIDYQEAWAQFKTMACACPKLWQPGRLARALVAGDP